MNLFTLINRENEPRAHELQHTFACPTVKDLRKIIKMNSVRDFPINFEDIKLAEALYGPAVPSIKEK